MCAYITGQIGECEVGDDMAALALQEAPSEFIEWCEYNIGSRPDEYGNYRPVSIYATPGWFNTGLGLSYPDSEWGKQYVIDEYKKACKDYAEKNNPSFNGPGPGRYPVFNSVAIYFDELPSTNQIAIIKERAYKFAQFRPDGDKSMISISGFRILQETVTLRDITPHDNICNRHDDCCLADQKARESGLISANHCHDDCCEDCYGT